MSFAFSEVLAHLNYMLRQGTLAWAEPQDGVERVIACSDGASIRDGEIAR